MLRLLTRSNIVNRSGRSSFLPQLRPRPVASLLRPISNLPKQQGLYHPENEKDSCGVGLVAHLKGQTSRKIVEDANRMLVRMSHRGGIGCERNSGDGAGILVGTPHEFLKGVAADMGFELPAKDHYAVGNVFLSQDPDMRKRAKDLLAVNLDARGLRVLGWRPVPVDNSMLGATSLGSEPVTEQIFVENTPGLSPEAFDEELYFARTVASHEAETAGVKDCHVCSLSAGTVTYKGQLTPEQVMEYFVDLQQPGFCSHLALVHSRFSTNTFPSWDRAQPNRMMCHNGEINTLRGNKNWMASRDGLLRSDRFGLATQRLLPAVSDNMSDSGNFDSVLEVLNKAGGRDLPQAMCMMIPEAWQNKDLPQSKKDMYEYFSCLMEPWDGPAMMAFTDGRCIGATLDRNGLRPSRYYVTHDDVVLLSSEVGVVPDLAPELVKEKRRLEPGRMFLIDFGEGRIVNDKEVKEKMAAEHPYGDWLRDQHLYLSDWARDQPGQVQPFNFSNTNRRLNMFGYTTETMSLLLLPMVTDGKEALGSMGADAPIPVLSEQPSLPFGYFKQLFAQVTNPPIDPIREELVMSLRCPVGPERNLFHATAEHANRLTIDHPILTLEECAAVSSTSHRGWRGHSLDATFAVGSGPAGLRDALARLCEEASAALHGEDAPPQMLLLSDRNAGPDRLPVPSLLAVGAVHQHLLRTKQRPKVALVSVAGDAREVHDAATLLGYGADAVCPYTAYEALCRMNQEGLVQAKAGRVMSDEEVIANYRGALGKGLMKVMSKMGISTMQSYKGAQVFEAVGLAEEVVDVCFSGTITRIGGAGWDALYTDIERFHDAAFPPDVAGETQASHGASAHGGPLLPNPGHYLLRHGGEQHLNTPAAMTSLQQAARNNCSAAYQKYADETNQQVSRVTLRGLLRLKTEAVTPIALEAVEPAAEIVKRFVTGAMSLGSISKESHEALAVAMNELGGRSNTGEGGEDVSRFGDNRRSSIKQVASGRFGVTSNYLANSDQIQIKMAQGAKPGEGGELPGGKVSSYIGSVRRTTPGVGLISPPPHHDIYCIEDLAQLIHDLKSANPKGEVSVKLVSECGVGVVAAGVAKAKADHITVSGYDGGTGAAVWTSIKNAGLPWELGVAEAQQTLVLNNLRSRVKLQTDGQLKTGRDVLIAGLLGAEEFGFATAPLIALGCVMMRKCHLNTCPVGIATQDPILRDKFEGKPEHVVNFFFMLAEEIRGYMAELGIAKFEDLVGRSDLLELDESRLHYKSEGLDLSNLLASGSSMRADAGVIHSEYQDHELEGQLDNRLMELAAPALLEGKPTTIDLEISNLNRSLGTMLSNAISRQYGENGLPAPLTMNLRGHGGQSLGFCLAKGVELNLEGDSNDHVGKSLSGGSIAVFPDRNRTFVAEDNVVVGNVALYGATSGTAFFRGKAGERFAVRNSGALAVVEGLGDHGCEYMTGGNVVVLGPVGRNFAAGMSGGLAFVYDPENRLPSRLNADSVKLEPLDAQYYEGESEQLKGWIQEHVSRTGSTVGQSLLDSWGPEVVNRFVKVYPDDYRRVLEASAALERAKKEGQRSNSFAAAA